MEEKSNLKNPAFCCFETPWRMPAFALKCPCPVKRVVQKATQLCHDYSWTKQNLKGGVSSATINKVRQTPKRPWVDGSLLAVM